MTAACGETTGQGSYQDFDDVIDVVGGFGKYQKLVVFLVILPFILPPGLIAINIVFMVATPDEYGCALPIENFTVADLSTYAPRERRNGEMLPSRCLMYNLNFTSLNRAQIQNLIAEQNSTLPTVACAAGWVYSTDVYLTTVVAQWDLVCEHEVLASVCFACDTLGALFGSLGWAFLADRFGRKPTLFGMLLFQLTFAVATAFAPSLAWFAVFRFLTGSCTALMYSLPLLFTMELTGRETRALMSVLCSIAYTSSVLIGIGLAYLIRTWHGLALATSAPLFLLFLLWPFLPESPRWLLAQKRYTELEEFLKKIARVNGRHLPAEFETKLPEIIRHFDEEVFVEKTSVLDLFRTRNMRKKTLVLAFIEFCNMGVFYGLNLFEPAFGTEPHYNSLLVNLVELPPYVFARFLCDRAGRRLTLFYPMLLCSVLCLATSGMPSTSATVVLGLSLSAKLCITLTYLVGELYEEELFPTVIRSQGQSFTVVIAQIAGILVPFVVALGNTYAVLPLTIFGALCCVAAASALFLPETAGSDLPQTLHDGESFGSKMTWKDVWRLYPTRRKTNKAATKPITTNIVLVSTVTPES